MEYADVDGFAATKMIRAMQAKNKIIAITAHLSAGMVGKVH